MYDCYCCSTTQREREQEGIIKAKKWAEYEQQQQRINPDLYGSGRIEQGEDEEGDNAAYIHHSRKQNLILFIFEVKA